jgi:hypothetical protein
MSTLVRLGKVVQIHPRLTASDWSLYSEEQGADGAALCMNAQFHRLVNAGLSKNGVRKEMRSVFEKFSRYGATDTAVRETFEFFLDHIYGLEP